MSPTPDHFDTSGVTRDSGPSHVDVCVCVIVRVSVGVFLRLAAAGGHSINGFRRRGGGGAWRPQTRHLARNQQIRKVEAV